VSVQPSPARERAAGGGPAGAAAAVRVRAVAIPAWAWLAGIVVVSAAVRIALGRHMVAPWIMVDELIYSELAKSFAEHGRFLVRGEASTGYGFVYPVLLAPAWRIFGAVPDAYAAAKAINAVVMSLAAVPAYFLARRLLRPALALVGAALTVTVPSMLYTGTLMTENVFYPLFLTVALLLVLTLERPTAARQVGLLVLCGVVFAARAQAVVLVPAAATAPVLLALFERRPLRTLRRFAPLYGLLAAGAAGAVLVSAARGRSPLSLLGAYRAATDSSYTVGTVLRYVLYHVAELDLYLGFVPFAALLALWLAPRSLPPAGRVFAAASLPLVAYLVLLVAAFASQPSVARIEERNMFYVAPLALIALLALVDGIQPRRAVLLAAGAVAAVLPVFIPYPRLITTSAVSDTFALLPWWWVQDRGIHLDQLRWVVFAVGVAACAALLVPRRLALVLPALVAVYFAATSFVVENGRHGIRRASIGSLWAAVRVAHPDWIDQAAGRDADVSYLWTGKLDARTVWVNEFFNRSFGRVYDLGGASPGGLPETAVARRADGRLVADGTPIRASYVLADGSVDIAGRPVARDPRIGLSLFRVAGPVVVLTNVEGLYPDDTWSGRTVTYSRVECPGGRLSTLLGSDPSLFSRPQVVTARSGDVVRRVAIAPAGQARLSVPLRPGPDRVCRVRFDVARTENPARLDARSSDDRELGAHFLRFDYSP
jgi:hypothetical protein